MTKHDRESGRAPLHKEVWKLLPWYLNGSLRETELEIVESHIATCSTCQAELVSCSQVHSALQERNEVAPSPHPARFANLMARIDAAEIHRLSPWRRGLEALRASWMTYRSSFATTPYLLRGALATQLIVIVLLAGAVAADWSRESEPSYRTLSQGSAAEQSAPGQIRVLFADGLSVGEIRDLLQPIAAKVIDGPTELGVYTLAVPLSGGEEDSLAQAIDHLRSAPKVRLAEPVYPTKTEP